MSILTVSGSSSSDSASIWRKGVTYEEASIPARCLPSSVITCLASRNPCLSALHLPIQREGCGNDYLVPNGALTEALPTQVDSCIFNFRLPLGFRQILCCQSWGRILRKTPRKLQAAEGCPFLSLRGCWTLGSLCPSSPDGYRILSLLHLQRPTLSFSAAGTFFSALDPVSTLSAFLPQVVQLSTWVGWPLTSLPAAAAALRCRLSISVARLMFSELLYTISSVFLFVPLFLYIFFLFLGFS